MTLDFGLIVPIAISVVLFIVWLGLQLVAFGLVMDGEGWSERIAGLLLMVVLWTATVFAIVTYFDSAPSEATVPDGCWRVTTRQGTLPVLVGKVVVPVPHGFRAFEPIPCP